jgi:hypothetical protein
MLEDQHGVPILGADGKDQIDQAVGAVQLTALHRGQGL